MALLTFLNLYYNPGTVLCTSYLLSHLIVTTSEQGVLRWSVALLSQEDLACIWREVVASPGPSFKSGTGL